MKLGGVVLDLILKEMQWTCSYNMDMVDVMEKSYFWSNPTEFVMLRKH